MVTRFILAVHCHQPVGNFPWVFEEAYQSAYLPFLSALERHPKVKVVFHYSGSLLDWLGERHPEFIKTLRGMFARGQVELLGGGYYEPILTMIPAQDAAGQLEKMNEILRRLGLTDHRGPAGTWLAERVWEPQLPSLLTQAGIRYTIVDDHHLKLAGIPEEERFGYYLAEDRGNEIALFPSLKLLRYLVPFKPVHEVMDALGLLRSEEPRAVVLADDGEKFGLWPGTARWVYQEGWLESFFTELSRQSERLISMTFRQYLEEFPPLGRTNLPCASYEEMGEWASGNFRNFLVKYPEARTLYRKMLWVSQRLEETSAKVKGKKWNEARDHLYRAQANDPYWHGVFGGLYLRHLRRGAYAELLQSERLLDAQKKRGKIWVEGDMATEEVGRSSQLHLRSDNVTLLFYPDEGAQLVEMSDKERRVNLLDTLTRRPEPYHKKLSALHQEKMAAVASAGGEPATIHERRGPSSLEEPLVYDPYRRAGLIDHAFSSSTRVQEFAAGAAHELGDFVGAPYETGLRRSKNEARALFTREGSVRMDEAEHPLILRKTVTLSAKAKGISITYQLVNRSDRTLTFLFGSELNLNMKDAHVNRVGEVEGVKHFSVTDPAARLRLSLGFSRHARLWYFPLETLSDSERGMERTYQGVNLTSLWQLTLAPGKDWKVKETLTIESLHDPA